MFQASSVWCRHHAVPYQGLMSQEMVSQGQGPQGVAQNKLVMGAMLAWGLITWRPKSGIPGLNKPPKLVVRSLLLILYQTLGRSSAMTVLSDSMLLKSLQASVLHAVPPALLHQLTCSKQTHAATFLWVPTNVLNVLRPLLQ